MGDIVLLVDSDTRVPEDCLSKSSGMYAPRIDANPATTGGEKRNQAVGTKGRNLQVKAKAFGARRATEFPSSVRAAGVCRSISGFFVCAYRYWCVCSALREQVSSSVTRRWGSCSARPPPSASTTTSGRT